VRARGGDDLPGAAEPWERRLANLQASVRDALAVPALIVNSMNGTLRNPDGTFRFMIADGSHRLEALKRMGKACFHVPIWFVAEEQRAEYLAGRKNRRG
jgi:hypothetical protein